MDNTAKLSDLAKGEIEALQAEGYELTPADIVEINALAWETLTPDSSVALSRGIPVFIGNVALWPMTIKAAEWYTRIGSRLPFSTLQTYALAYAMINAYKDGAFGTGALGAVKAVTGCALGLMCRSVTLLAAISQVLQQDEIAEQPPDDKKDNGAGMQLAELARTLAANTGDSVEFWENRCSVATCFRMLSTISEQNRADDKPLAGDPRIQAEAALGWKIVKIKQRTVNNG